jgi:ABC-type amino acid transport substrate-binding protein
MSWYQGVETRVAFSAVPVFQVYADVYLNRKSPARISSMADFARGAVVGIVNEYEYPESVSQSQRGGVTFQAAPNDGANLKMLARGRLDAAIIMTNELEPPAQKPLAAGVDSDVTFAFRSGIENAFVGFSKKHPLGDSARRQFDLGYQRLVADGTIEAIRRKWTTKAAQ